MTIVSPLLHFMKLVTYRVAPDGEGRLLKRLPAGKHTLRVSGGGRQVTRLDRMLTLEHPRMTYREAMDRYGIDRPDTRFGLELVDISDLAPATGFGVFTDALAKRKGIVKATAAPNLCGARKKSATLGNFLM